MGSNLILPNSGEMVPTVKWAGHTFPIRSLNEEVIPKGEPKALIAATVVQIQDHTNLLWAGLYALAKDIYRKEQGEAPKEFLSFVNDIGLRIMDANGIPIDVASELSKP